ncbi:FecR family protein [Spirosoma soli]|uniref:FecR family protein n=1 Tax=Spirosoma soli TaxID=1770529 RepID=A0ABW5M248_9BACT
MNHENYTVDDFLMDDQFLAYCRGSDPAAVAFWETWQSGKPPNLVAFEKAKRLHNVLSGQKPRLDESLQELETLIHNQNQPAQVIPMPVPRRSRVTFQWWAVAASVLVVSTLSWLGYQYWNNQYVTYKTAYNQRQSIQLPDGSTVTLNSHSVLRHRRNAFSEDGRSVELEGEGYFSVRHLTTHAPFRVRTNGAFDVQVLGTEFSVYDRPALHRVVLNTGRVQVDFHDKRADVILQPGQLIETSDTVQPTKPRTVRADQYNAWLRNQLVFENTSLSEAIRTVEEQFGVKVQVEGVDLKNRTVTGILPINEPETVLNALAELAQLNIRQKDNVFVLSRQ